jgi:hypothetical protein
MPIFHIRASGESYNGYSTEREFSVEAANQQAAKKKFEKEWGWWGSILSMKAESKNHSLNCLKARGAGLAATTKGRKTTFKDKKKEAKRKACRNKQNED